MNTPKKSTTTRVGILKAIKSFKNRKGIAPSSRDLMSECDMSSPSVVNYHLDWLVEKGYLEKVPFVSRGIIGVTEDGEQFISSFEGETND